MCVVSETRQKEHLCPLCYSERQTSVRRTSCSASQHGLILLPHATPAALSLLRSWSPLVVARVATAAYL